MQMLVRKLGCLPRNARMCRPGTDVGPRRTGERPPPLNGPATRRTVAAFVSVARELAASAQARTVDDLERATARATRRAAQAQTRVMRGAARSLSQVASAMQDIAALRDALAGGSKRNAARSGARKAGAAPKPPSRAERARAQERVRYQQEAQMHEAHAMRRAALAARLAGVETAPSHDGDPARRGDSERRTGGTSERNGRSPLHQPRVRRL